MENNRENKKITESKFPQNSRENSRLIFISSNLSSALVTFSVIYTTYKFLFWLEEKYYDIKYPRVISNIDLQEESTNNDE